MDLENIMSGICGKGCVWFGVGEGYWGVYFRGNDISWLNSFLDEAIGVWRGWEGSGFLKVWDEI